MSNLEFTQSFYQYRPTLMSFAVHLTKDEEEANDLMQDTAYKAFKYRNMYKPHTNLRAWLMTIMRNTFINNYRQRKRRRTLQDSTANQYWINAGNGQAYNTGESEVTMKELMGMVERLDDWLKVPFLMHYQGFKYEEIAQELEIPLGTVKSRIFFARRKLQEGLEKLYPIKNIKEMMAAQN